MSSREAASIVDMWQPMVQALQVVIMFSNCVIMFQCFRVYLFKVCYWYWLQYIFHIGSIETLQCSDFVFWEEYLEYKCGIYLKYLCKNLITWRMKGALSFRLILFIHSLSFYLFPLYDIVHSNTYLFVIYISFQELTTFMLIQVFKSTGVEELMFLVSQLKTKLHPQVNPSYHTGCNYNNFTSSFNFLL